MFNWTLAHAGTLADAGDFLRTGVRDAEIFTNDQGTFLYTVATTEATDIAAYEITPQGAMVFLGSVSLPFAPMAGASPNLTLSEGDGGPMLLVAGINDEPTVIGIGSDGNIGSTSALPNASALLQAEIANVNGTTFAYGIDTGGQISHWDVSQDGGSALGPSSDAPPQNPLSHLTSVAVGSSTVLVGLSQTTNTIESYSAAPDGSLTSVQSLSAETSLYVGAPSDAVAVQSGGASFVVVASAGSGTLTVIGVDESGALTITDHILDTLDTRFGGASVLATVEHNGRTYVSAAGSDDGLTVFELLPTGTLIEKATVADELDTTLENVSAITMVARDGEIDIIVASNTEAGLTTLRVDLDNVTGGASQSGASGGAPEGLIIVGTAGDDSLEGGDGADIILDGRREDDMRGGNGADLFVLTADNALDTIRDFDRYEDSLDLSGWAFLRSVHQLTVAENSTGATIEFGEEKLRLVTTDRQPLTIDEIISLDLIGLTRLLPAWSEQFEPEVIGGGPDNPKMTITGTSGDDDILGGSFRDTIFGGDGADKIQSSGGPDFIYGGEGADSLHGNAGKDFLSGGNGDDNVSGGWGTDEIYGGSGNDSIFGNLGFDTLFGGDGDDYLIGHFGNDTVYGGDGDDRILGGNFADILMGDEGNDHLSGNNGADVLKGGNGMDVLEGNAGTDTLFGGGGDDYILGGINHDILYGGSGADEMHGGPGFDTLYGGEGNDSVFGKWGQDRLDGGGGDDDLIGGTAADVFIYHTGHDRILDFEDNRDTVEISAALIDGAEQSFETLTSHLQSSDNGTFVLDFGNGNTLEVRGLEEWDDLANDFDFY